MGHVEFEGKQNGRSLNVTYTDLANEGTVHFEIFTPDGELGIAIGATNVEALHDSLGAWLELRKKEKKEKRAAKKQADAERSQRGDTSATTVEPVKVPVVRSKPRQI